MDIDDAVNDNRIAAPSAVDALFGLADARVALQEAEASKREYKRIHVQFADQQLNPDKKFPELVSTQDVLRAYRAYVLTIPAINVARRNVRNAEKVLQHEAGSLNAVA